MAIAVLCIAAAASALRGGKFVHEEAAASATIAASGATSGAGTDIVADDVAADEITAEEIAANGSGHQSAGQSGKAVESVRAADGRATPNG